MPRSFIAALALFFWLMVNFVTELHGFTSPGLVFVGILFSLMGGMDVEEAAEKAKEDAIEKVNEKVNEKKEEVSSSIKPKEPQKPLLYCYPKL